MINLREWALPVYTIMMQMAAGTMLMLWIFYTAMLRRHGTEMADRLSKNLVTVIFVTVVVAMIGSHYHLSRPLYSIFAVRNFGSSWLSREIVFTVAFAVLVGVLWLLQVRQLGTVRLRLVVGWGAVAMGIVTVYCMSRVYLLPTQAAWNIITTPAAFFGAMILLGCLALSALLVMNLYVASLRQDGSFAAQQDIINHTLNWIVIFVVATALSELATYIVQINLLADGDASARASLDLLLGLYGALFGVRLGMLCFGVLGLAGVILWQRRTGRSLAALLTPVHAIFLLVLISEVLGRFLFYAVHVRIGI